MFNSWVQVRIFKLKLVWIILTGNVNKWLLRGQASSSYQLPPPAYTHLVIGLRICESSNPTTRHDWPPSQNAEINLRAIHNPDSNTWTSPFHYTHWKERYALLPLCHKSWLNNFCHYQRPRGWERHIKLDLCYFVFVGKQINAKLAYRQPMTQLQRTTLSSKRCTKQRVTSHIHVYFRRKF